MNVSYVALGDSTAVGIGATRGGGFPDRLASLLRQAGHAVGLTVVGVSGARLQDVIDSQLKKAVAAAPTLVTISVGTNDLWRGTPVPEVEASFDRIAARLKQTGASLVVSNIPDMALAPVAKLVPASFYEGRIEPFNEAIDRVRSKHGFHVVDLYSMSRAYIPTHPEFFSGDGFHPSDLGYDKWAELALPIVSPLLR